ncbi:RHS repeat-associated core domain-containing protein [Pantoea sp. Tr-811]|uniref:RHS repeat-associated core domain-containing protein n=1 Tax=Pantoea sp. Tr-811 TaxID=2608361 RepID=UPI001420BA4A|nr:RHS repeat-associated core domain-containing protein [Pantoea sp. Tr-811]NIF26271.1 RHS repeat-associated core domain-containing protein [Pantoea sp. Tr-811]
MSLASTPKQGVPENCTEGLKAAFARYFYQGNNLFSRIQGSKQQSIFRLEQGLLAQCEIHDNLFEVGLICHDAKLSVSRMSKRDGDVDIAYTPYGYASSDDLKDAISGFNGEPIDQITGYYLLGNGYRIYSSSLMRYGSPDSLSPFGEGGRSAYMYCMGEPVSFTDPTGHFRLGSVFSRLRKVFFSPRKPGKDQTAKGIDIGYHGTSGAAAKKILKGGVKSTTGTFFVTDTFENASRYAALKKNGTVLAVSTIDFAKVKDNSARALVRSKGINELRIGRPAHPSLRFTRVSSAGQTADFNRFITLEDQMARDIQMFNAGLRQAS